jgi:hypothetical protein
MVKRSSAGESVGVYSSPRRMGIQPFLPDNASQFSSDAYKHLDERFSV